MHINVHVSFHLTNPFVSKKYANFTIEMERFTVHDYRKNESKQNIHW